MTKCILCVTHNQSMIGKKTEQRPLTEEGKKDSEIVLEF